MVLVVTIDSEFVDAGSEISLPWFLLWLKTSKYYMAFKMKYSIG